MTCALGLHWEELFNDKHLPHYELDYFLSFSSLTDYALHTYAVVRLNRMIQFYRVVRVYHILLESYPALAGRMTMSNLSTLLRVCSNK